MRNPYRSIWIKRLGLHYWHGLRFWKWRPRIKRAWYGKIRHYCWLCFEVSWDSRGNWLADMTEPERLRRERDRRADLAEIGSGDG